MTLWFLKRKKSKGFAIDRIRKAINYDKSGITAEILNNIRYDIVRVLGRYADISSEGVDLSVASGGGDRGFTLVTSIPIRRVKSM